MKAHLWKYRNRLGFIWLKFRNEIEGFPPYLLAVSPLWKKRGLKRGYVFEKCNLKIMTRDTGEMTLKTPARYKGHAEGFIEGVRSYRIIWRRRW